MRLKFKHPPTSGYALLIVLGTLGISLIMLTATMNRTTGVEKMNGRNIQYNAGINAAEAATEKVYARMSYDFQTYGLGNFTINLPIYRTNVPNASENPYWTNFVFSDAQGHDNQTSIVLVTNFSGPMPSQYPGLFTVNSPVYRIVSNTRMLNTRYQVTNAVQVDILMALVPITTYAIFYNGLLEFSTCADMTVNGRVHSNDKIFTGTSASLTFNSTVTASSTLSSPYNNGSGPWTFPGGVFNGSPQYSTNVPTVTLSINMTNTHSFIEMPVTNDSDTLIGQQRLYNQAQVVLLVSNTTVTAKVQAAPGYGMVPGQDTSPFVITSTNTPVALSTNFPFLTTTNTFLDQREDKTNLTSQIDVGKYANWLLTNSSVQTKFSAASGTYPTILYVADQRTTTATQLAVVRLTNGIAPPVNGGLGWSVATKNPLYILGNYNQTNSSYLATTNTSSGTVPCAFMSDALTLLSPSWSDATSFTASQTGQTPSGTTVSVNAAIITGNVPSTSTNSSGFSGGVHNLPRLLENWTSSRQVWLNTSIINLYASTIATNKFVTPGTGSYYTAPTRKFSFDMNFMDPAKQPPGVPTALVPIRYNWGVPPPNRTNYNVIP